MRVNSNPPLANSLNSGEVPWCLSGSFLISQPYVLLEFSGFSRTLVLFITLSPACSECVPTLGREQGKCLLEEKLYFKAQGWLLQNISDIDKIRMSVHHHLYELFTTQLFLLQVPFDIQEFLKEPVFLVARFGIQILAIFFNQHLSIYSSVSHLL